MMFRTNFNPNKWKSSDLWVSDYTYREFLKKCWNLAMRNKLPPNPNKQKHNYLEYHHSLQLWRSHKFNKSLTCFKESPWRELGGGLRWAGVEWSIYIIICYIYRKFNKLETNHSGTNLVNNPVNHFLQSLIWNVQPEILKLKSFT